MSSASMLTPSADRGVHRAGAVGSGLPGSGLLGWLPWWTALAAGTELVVLRLFTRTAIHIPGFSEVRPLYVTISEVGRLAYYVAVVLLIVTIGLLVRELVRRQGAAAVAGASGLLLFVGLAAAARLASADGPWLAIGTVASLALVTPWNLGGSRGRSRAARALLLGGVLGASVLSEPTGLVAPGARAALAPVVELVAVTGAIATPLLLVRRARRSALVWGALAAVVVLAALAANPWTVKILLLWNLGLAGYLPSVCYAAAAGALTTSVVSLSSHGRTASAVGVVLLVAGGIGSHSTYQTGLVLAGLVLLGLGERTGAVRASAREPA